jgi:hypothetical protein
MSPMKQVLNRPRAVLLVLLWFASGICGHAQEDGTVGEPPRILAFQKLLRSVPFVDRAGSDWLMVDFFSGSEATVSWYRSGELIAERLRHGGDVMGLTPSETEFPIGDWYVEVRNAYGSARSESIPVRWYPLTILTLPQEVVWGEYGGKVVLKAFVFGAASQQYNWYHEGEWFARTSEEVLTIENLREQHTGQWYVVATNLEGGATSTVAQVSIAKHETEFGKSLTPTEVVVPRGGVVRFALEAKGYPFPRYTWYHNGHPMEGPNGPELNIPEARPEDTGVYEIVGENPYRTTKAKFWYELRVIGQPSDPSSTSGVFLDPPGGTMRYVRELPFNVTLTSRIPGAVLRYTLNGLDPTASSHISGGSVLLKGDAVLRVGAFVNGVLQGPIAVGDYVFVPESQPTFFEQPQDIEVDEGGTAHLQARAIGWGPDLTYTWISWPGSVTVGTGPSLDLPGIQISQSGRYCVRVENSWGWAYSERAHVKVRPAPGSPFSEAPRIIEQPRSQERYLMSPITVSATATGSPPLDWAWYFNGQEMPWARGESFSFAHLMPSVVGDYYAVVRNFRGAATSQVARLRLAPPGTAPLIWSQPQSTEVLAGGYVSLEVGVDGPGELKYAWFHDGVRLEWGKGPRLAQGGVQTAQAGDYWVVVSNDYGSVRSETAHITIRGSRPVITVQPESKAVTEGESLYFTTQAQSSTPLSYAWYRESQAGAVGSGPLLRFGRVSAGAAGGYYAVVTDAHASATTLVARLTVLPAPPPPPPAAPILVQQPVSLAVEEGGTVQFRVVASGQAPFLYQWYKDGRILPAGSGQWYRIDAADFPSAGEYSVRVSNAGGTVISDPAILTVRKSTAIQPSLVSQPRDRSYEPGEVVILSVDVSGTPPFSYVWRRRDGTILATAGPSIQTEATPALSGDYSVTITNRAGSVTTEFFRLTVNEPAPPQPVLGGTVILSNRSIGVLDAPVFAEDGLMRLEGTDYLVQLFAGRTADDLEAVGRPLPFRSGPGAGYFFGGAVEIRSVLGGENAFLQLRAWVSAAGATFDQAQSAGGRTGISGIFALRTGNAGVPPSLPVVLAGLESFSLLRGGAQPARVVHGPVSVETPAGTRLVLEVTAEGTPPLSYRWFRNGKALPEATSARLEFASIGPAEAGSYQIRVTNGLGFEDSDPAVVTVTVPRFAPEIVVGPGGRVIADPAGLDYPAGTQVTLRAIPDPGFVLTGWSGDGVGNGESRILVMEAPRRVEAKFRRMGGIVRFANVDRAAGVEAPVAMPGGMALVSGPEFVAQLFRPRSDGVWVSAGRPLPFGVNEEAGAVVPAMVEVVEVEPGSSISFVMRAWRVSDGASYESAIAARGLVGASSTVTVLLGDSREPGATGPPLAGLMGFRLANAEAPSGEVVATPPAVWVGDRVELRALVSGHPPPTIQWLKDGADIHGATNSSLVLAPVGPDDQGEYAVRLVNDAGSQITRTVRVNPTVRPAVLGLDGPRSLVYGDSARWVVQASGGLPLRYEWYLGGPGDLSHPLPGEVGELSLAQLTTTTEFWVRVGDGIGWVDSPTVLVKVEPREAKVFLDSLTQVADGTPRRPVMRTEPPGLPVSLSFDGLTGDPVDPGSYPLVATVVETGYRGSVSTAFTLLEPPGEIAATVFEDIDGDGRKQPGEIGLEGITVRLSGAGEERLEVSDGEGAVRFPRLTPGLYLLQEISSLDLTPSGLPARWVTIGPGVAAEVVEFGNLPVGVVTGHAFVDLDGNALAGPDERRLAGVVVRLRTPSIERSVTTGADGAFRFAHCPAGAFSLEAICPAEMEASTELPRTVSLGARGSARVDLGFRWIRTIAGVVFEDRDGDGLRDSDESGIRGGRVLLRRAEDNMLLSEATSDAEGAFSFQNLSSGEFRLEQHSAEGWTLKTAGDQVPRASLQAAGSLTPTLHRRVSLSPGSGATVAFANYRAGRITGYVRLGLGAGDCIGRSGVRVVVSDLNSGRTAASALTVAGGGYVVDGLPAGTYRVEPITQDETGHRPDPIYVVLQSHSAAIANFVATPPGTLLGRLYVDANRDGGWQPGETGLGGWEIALRQAGRANRTALTGSDGSYLFTGVPAGPGGLEVSIPEGFESATFMSTNWTMEAGGAVVRGFAMLPRVRSQRWGEAYGRWADMRNLALDNRSPEADPDGDELPNLMEYVLGTLPDRPEPDAAPRASVIRTAQGPVAGYVLRWDSLADRKRVLLEVSNDLARWSVIQPMFSVVTPGNGVDVVRLLDPEPFGSLRPRFLRLRVELLPAVEP